MSKIYCPLIDHQIMVNFQNKTKACCQFETDSSYKDYNTMMQSYREDMKKGIKIKPCRRCWEDEDKGFPSLRQSAIEDFKRYSNISGTMILDLRISNNCNLACTMCNEHASSLWGKLLGINQTNMLNNDLQDELIKNSQDLIKLSIQGGEPFYGTDFIDFVDKLPNKSNMQLEIFSNIITANVDVITQWITEFQHVMIIASIDGTKEVFEDIRWPASWSKFEKKIKLLYNLKKLGLSFNFTLQNNNILNLKQFIDWRNDVVPDCPITISILEWPNHFHFTNLTNDERINALKILGNIDARTDELKIIKTVKELLLISTENKELLQTRYLALENTLMLRNKYLMRAEITNLLI